MGFRFRRSIKIAPGIRLNLNTKSTSVRIGPRGLGYTISSTGKKHVSAGIPGTGLHFTEQIAPAGKTRPVQREPIAQPLNLIEPEKKSPSAYSIVITIVAILFGVAWCSGRSPSTTVQTEASRQSENVEIAPVGSPAVPSENVSIARQTVVPATITLFTTAAVRLRSGPSTDTTAILTVPAGEKVKSSGAKGQWHHVAYDSRTGWIRGDYLAKQKPVPRKAPAVIAPLKKAPARSRAGQPVRVPYSGRCDCPYDVMRNGRLCGGRSAYSRPGGRSPVCYY